MTTCPKCKSNKVTKRHFAVGDKVPLTEYYRGRQWEGSYWVVTEALIEFTCRDCGHQWAHPPTDAISGFRKQILKEAKARQELQTALGAKSQAAEVLMLEAVEKLKDIKYVAEQYKQAAHHAVEENQKLRDEVENLRIENTALRNQIARDVGVAASREINYLRAKVKQLEAANIALVTKGTVWERENVPEDIRDLVAQGMSPTEADLMNQWGSSLEATKKLCKILGRKAPSRLRNATDILEKHIIPLIEGGKLGYICGIDWTEDHVAKTMKENEKLKQQNEELIGALDNWAASEKELKRKLNNKCFDVKGIEERERRQYKRLSDLVTKWRSRACIVWSDGAADTLHDCAEELEEQL